MTESVDTVIRFKKITRPFSNIGVAALLTLLYFIPTTTSVSLQLSGAAVLIGAVGAGISEYTACSFTQPLRWSMEPRYILSRIGAVLFGVFLAIFLSDSHFAVFVYGGLGFMWTGAIYSLFSYYVRG